MNILACGNHSKYISSVKVLISETLKFARIIIRRNSYTTFSSRYNTIYFGVYDGFHVLCIIYWVQVVFRFKLVLIIELTLLTYIYSSQQLILKVINFPSTLKQFKCKNRGKNDSCKQNCKQFGFRQQSK